MNLMTRMSQKLNPRQQLQKQHMFFFIDVGNNNQINEIKIISVIMMSDILF